jgi:adenylate kinase family enzyme
MANRGPRRDHPAPGHRICVVGTSGSGKTYVAQALASAMGLTYVSNDSIIWRPDWQPAPEAERIAEFKVATRGDRWSFDGNLDPDQPADRLALARCDTVVWLDLPRWQVHWQVLRRTVTRVMKQEPLWYGNRESFRMMLSRDSIIWWSVKTYRRRRRQYATLFADEALAGKRRIRLRSRAEVDAWLEEVAATVQPPDHGTITTPAVDHASSTTANRT